MKKVLKKSVEAEIRSVLENFFHQKDEDAAKKMTKSVNKVSGNLSKEFIKQVTKLKKARARKTASSGTAGFQISKSEKIYGVPSATAKNTTDTPSSSRSESGKPARKVNGTTSGKRTTRSRTKAKKPAAPGRSETLEQ
jgi:hypothetical protein